jgi:hypothetical protein
MGKDYKINGDEKALLDARRAAYKSGKVKGMSLEEVNRKLANSLDDVFGIWKNKSISLNKIRDEQWRKRN